MTATPAPDATSKAPARYRGIGIVLIGMSGAIWWPAFTLGAWHTLFFDQLLTVWVVATAGFVVVLIQPARIRVKVGRAIALLIPSLWLALSFTEAPAADDLWGNLFDLLAIVVGLAGIPFTLWVVVRTVWPDVIADYSLGARIGIFAIVAAIAVASFLLGLNQSSFLTCEDFTLSGNSEPPGCVHTDDSPTP
ncbi:hypothetical protein [Microbacterium sp. NPDC056569]|uniref:hypothetical protein n=1 Tax=Microbacterium sp. NPDC056569 TaxID=3345867 RepID=UPI00366BE0A6